MTIARFMGALYRTGEYASQETMLLTLSTTHAPATDLGFLLHKNPARRQSFEMTFGQAHVFYAEATAERCTVSLLLEVDPVRLVRGSEASREGGTFDQYVNDRPYAASSFLSSAILECFGTAMAGRSKERQELADQAIPLEVWIPVMPMPGGEALVRRLFEPLGYEVEIELGALDESFPEWGRAPHGSLRLRVTGRVRDVLTHLYVLIPVVDQKKHYYVGKDEVEKLVARGGDWLANHPQKEEIARRYLLRDRTLMAEALARLAEMEDDEEESENVAEVREEAELKLERPLSLHEQRLDAVAAALVASGARSVLDLGCGEGRLLQRLLKEGQFRKMVGMDVSWRSLQKAHRWLRMDRLPGRVAERIQLIQGSLVYRDRRLEGYDAAALVEVIEHLDDFRLGALERVVFEFARPETVILTTPNREYNPKFEGLPVGKLRHADHRFEWTRAEFEAWVRGVCDRHGYRAEIRPLGPEDVEVGAPSQMAVFTRA